MGAKHILNHPATHPKPFAGTPQYRIFIHKTKFMRNLLFLCMLILAMAACQSKKDDKEKSNSNVTGTTATNEKKPMYCSPILTVP
jgi:hypothetical protein